MSQRGRIDDGRDERHGRPNMATDRGRIADDLDDRLLALALGLDEDPALLAEIQRSPDLADRLGALERDLASVEDGLRAMVPDEPEGWADLSHERWVKLRPLVAATSGSSGRAGTWRPLWRRWQAVVPVLAAVLAAAVVFGVVASRDGLRTSERGAFDSTLTQKGASGGSSAAEGAAAPASVDAATVLEVRAGDYGTVVVAVAEPLDGAEQPFRVERTLKGTTAEAVLLRTKAGYELPPGSRALLFLDPRDDVARVAPPTVLARQAQPSADGADEGGSPGGSPGTRPEGENSGARHTAAVLAPAPGVFLRDGVPVVLVPLPGELPADRILVQ